jgi:NAD(P)-dependent dehydrogenase (short-subunit alcohol dehydrogenase family)
MTETVFITGADKGLGFALATRFLSAGFHVFAGAYLRDGAPSTLPTVAGQALLSLRKQFPQTLTVIPLDVSRMASIRAAVKRVARQGSGLDVLINNAGVHLEKEGASLEQLDFSDQHLEKTLAVNTFGPLRMTQQFLPLLAQGGRKLIINISSEAGSIADCSRVMEFAYCMSKSALNMQSKILQNALGPRGFKVLAVHPGWIRTDMGGPQAAVSADQSAEGIFQLATRAWSPDDPIYLDYEGKALRW